MADNRDLLTVLEELRDISDLLGDHYREKAYRGAVASIKKAKHEITLENVDNLLTKSGKLPGIGKGIHGKIREFLETGRIADLEELRADPKVIAYGSLTKIIGVGPATVRKWLEIGVDTPEKAISAHSAGKLTLNHMQGMGLKYYTDLNTRIPRADVTRIGEIVKAAILVVDPESLIEIAGSYRRGAETSGDIDIIVTNKVHFNDSLLEDILVEIKKDRQFIGELSAGEEKITFLYKYHGIVRQIDILNIPYVNYYAAMLYFTGSWSFNQNMRLIAKKKGYRLNQMGLFRDGQKLPLPVSSEREIFDLLEMAYVHPTRRN